MSADTRTAGEKLAAELAQACGYDPQEDCGLGALIDYKDACEGEMMRAVQALALIAAEVPTEDEWLSAADFMENVAGWLDAFGVARPAHYPEETE